MNLPIRKRYNWSIMARNNRKWLTILAASATALLTVLALDLYLDERAARMQAEQYANTIHHAKHIHPMGAPGTTMTDMIEGTWFMPELK